MVDHGVREHATWAASSSARNFHCSGALALSAGIVDNKENIHGARGTATHQISEKCLRTGAEPASFLDTVEKTKQHEIKIDEELVASAQMYVDYCLDRIRDGDTRYWIEERFSLADINPPFDAGGTGDFVIYKPAKLKLEIVDLKNGVGVVDALDNPQLKTYALGAMLRHKGLRVETVKVTIVQPNAHHKGGRIRSDTFHVMDLLEWTTDLLAAMRKSEQAIVEFKAAGLNSVLLDEWFAKWLNPGKCKWCPAEGFCPALKARAIDREKGIAKMYFEDFSEPKIANQPDIMSDEELAHTLGLLGQLEDWIKAVRAEGHSRAEAGREIPGYHLAEKHGNRKWAAEEAKLVSDLKKVVGLSDDQIYERSVKSPAQIEKVLGTKKKHLIENMWIKPVTGKNLVSADKSNSEPAPSSASQYFEKL